MAFEDPDAALDSPEFYERRRTSFGAFAGA
jgi:hypothetical protein